MSWCFRQVKYLRVNNKMTRNNNRVRIIVDKGLSGWVENLNRYRRLPSLWSGVWSDRNFTTRQAAIANREIRQAFRDAGRSNLLPFTRSRMTAKLAGLLNRARRVKNSKSPSPKNKNMYAKVPSLRGVGYGKRNNGGPGVIVISPNGNKRRVN